MVDCDSVTVGVCIGARARVLCSAFGACVGGRVCEFVPNNHPIAYGKCLVVFALYPPPPSGYGMARQCMCRGCGRWLTSQLLLLSSLNGCTSVTETRLSCFMSLHSRHNSGSSRCVPVRLHSAPSGCCSGGYSDCRNPSVPPPHFGLEACCAGLHVCVAIVLLCSCCHAHQASGLVL